MHRRPRNPQGSSPHSSLFLKGLEAPQAWCCSAPWETQLDAVLTRTRQVAGGLVSVLGPGYSFAKPLARQRLQRKVQWVPWTHSKAAASSVAARRSSILEVLLAFGAAVQRKERTATKSWRQPSKAGSGLAARCGVGQTRAAGPSDGRAADHWLPSRGGPAARAAPCHPHGTERSKEKKGPCGARCGRGTEKLWLKGHDVEGQPPPFYRQSHICS